MSRTFAFNFRNIKRVLIYNTIIDILMQHSRGKSALVFCSTRKGAQETAQCLSQTAMGHGFSNPFIKSSQQKEKLKEASLSCSDKQMRSFIIFGGIYLNINFVHFHGRIEVILVLFLSVFAT